MQSLLVFSLFFDDGDPIDARRYEAPRSVEEGIGRLFKGRLDNNRRDSTVASVRQCQVFVPYSGTLDTEVTNSAIELHLNSRRAFRLKWLEHWNNGSRQ